MNFRAHSPNLVTARWPRVMRQLRLAQLESDLGYCALGKRKRVQRHVHSGSTAPNQGIPRTNLLYP